ncbi:MAG: primosomal protein N' [Rhodanobacter sp.]
MPVVLHVALPVPLPHLFDYLPPDNGEARVGSRIVVPFGRRRHVGIVVAIDTEATVDARRLKQALSLPDNTALLDHELMQTLAWAADYWLAAPGEAYATALPQALRAMRPLPQLGDEYWSLSRAGRDALEAGSRRGGSHALLAALERRQLSTRELSVRLPGWRGAARRLASAGLLERSEQPAAASPTPASPAPVLSDEQQQAVATISASLGQYQPFLLDGVTGSGKTEVYLALIEAVLSRGQQALLLVPEIGLAPQALTRLRERLGVRVEVLHSNLAQGDRARAWLRAGNGSAAVILGTRSAVFTPLPNAGLIIVDEEHDSAFKQQDGFRYHARDLAVVRARTLGIPVVLGSGTPSLESLANAAAGRYRTLHLRARAGASRAPEVQVVDMRAQRLQHGMSPALLTAVADTLARGEQVLVFRNRRGYAPVLLCHQCGWHADCIRCERPLTLHARARRLVCHHCNFQCAVPDICAGCGATGLSAQGQGTERLEEALLEHFPQVPIKRVDRETMLRRDAFAQLLDSLRDDQPAILVGTQMLAKGHDLPNLTLVAIVSVDEGLLSVDFRASERLAQLVVQVAGRAGRARKPGRVILQTHHPEHPLLRNLLAHGYASTARDLLAERRASQLPPYAYQALLRAEAPGLASVDAFLSAALAALPASLGLLQVAGPMPAPMPLRAGRQRGQLLLEAPRRSQLRAVLRPWWLALHAMPEARHVRWSVDVDPIDLY